MKNWYNGALKYFCVNLIMQSIRFKKSKHFLLGFLMHNGLIFLKGKSSLSLNVASFEAWEKVLGKCHSSNFFLSDKMSLLFGFCTTFLSPAGTHIGKTTNIF